MLKKKSIIAGILCLLLACAPAAGIMAKAADSSNTSQEKKQQEASEYVTVDGQPLPESPEDLAPDYNDPDYVKRLMQQEQEPPEQIPFSIKGLDGKQIISPFTGLTYIQPQRQWNRAVEHGIDVSAWQAVIDWNKVKKAGVKFAFIRCGYTSLSSSFIQHEDNYFKRNIQEAYKAGVKVGIYYFSNSITASEAKKEAKKTLEIIEPYRDMITLPVVYDFEAFSNSYRAYGLKKARATANALIFLQQIQSEGYTAMYYSAPNFLASQFDVDQLSNYDFWLANYTTQTEFDGDFLYWQYASNGRVNGISGNTDCNFYYNPVFSWETPPIITEPSDSVEDLEAVTGLEMFANSEDTIELIWNETEGADGYHVYRSPALGGTYKRIETISGGAVTGLLDTRVAEAEGRQYYYKVVPYVMAADGGMKYGDEGEVLMANTKCVYQHRLRTKADLNLREQAGTEYAVLTVIPKDTALRFNRFTYSTTGIRWYQVTYKKNGESYTGYVSGSYVKKYTYGTASQKADIRIGAGGTFQSKVKVKKGTDLTILAETASERGVPWSRVSFVQGGKEYTGYMRTKFILRY